MKKQRCLFIIFVVLLASPHLNLAASIERETQERQLQLAVPLLVGEAALGPVGWAAMALSGLLLGADLFASQSRNEGSSCFGNKATCREWCHSNEVDTPWLAGVCLGIKCCMST